MFKHLLVPVDGSDVSKKSFKKVAELAKADKAAVTLVYVSDPMPPMVYSDSSMGSEFLKKTIRRSAKLMPQMSLKRLLCYWVLA